MAAASSSAILEPAYSVGPLSSVVADVESTAYEAVEVPIPDVFTGKVVFARFSDP